MNQKEKQQEEREIMEAVKVMRATIHGIARRKAAIYERQFLERVRDIIDEELDAQGYAAQYTAEYTAKMVEKEISMKIPPLVCNSETIEKINEKINESINEKIKSINNK